MEMGWKFENWIKLVGKSWGKLQVKKILTQQLSKILRKIESQLQLKERVHLKAEFLHL